MLVCLMLVTQIVVRTSANISKAAYEIYQKLSI